MSKLPPTRSFTQAIGGTLNVVAVGENRMQRIGIGNQFISRSTLLTAQGLRDLPLVCEKTMKGYLSVRYVGSTA